MRPTLWRLSKQTMQQPNQLEHLKQIFFAAVSSVQPSLLLQNNVSIQGTALTIVSERIELKKPCYVVGYGKGTFGMASTLLGILGGKNIEEGILTVPTGSFTEHKMSLGAEQAALFDKKFKVFEGAHNNLPDADAHKGAQQIEAFCKGLGEDDVLIVLTTGGGSNLLPLPKDGVSLQEKAALISELFRRGAGIHEVNLVRKKLSKIKGGGLARFAQPAKVFSLILSDVIGDPIDIIASGPTAPLPVESEQVPRTETKLSVGPSAVDTNANVASAAVPPEPEIKNLDAIEILQRYKLYEPLSSTVKEVLIAKEKIDAIANIKINENVKNFIIGNNTIACEAAKVKALELGYNPGVVSTRIQGQVPDLAEFYHEVVRFFQDTQRGTIPVERYQDIMDPLIMIEFEKMRNTRLQIPLCLIFGGEPTIVVSGSGKGGRNMHLALELSTKVQNYEGVYFLSCGTDGIDGPTDMAGAISPLKLTKDEETLAKTHLKKTDSYNFFATKRPDMFVKTGHTGTNVMDIQVIILVSPSK